DFALLCQLKRRFATAVRLYGEGFAEAPDLPQLAPAARYNAATCAVRAAGGQGIDAGQLADKERARLRARALEWLRADLGRWAKRLEADRPQERAAVAKVLREWLRDPDLAGVRDLTGLLTLTSDEREACEKLWGDVAALLRKAEGK